MPPQIGDPGVLQARSEATCLLVSSAHHCEPNACFALRARPIDSQGAVVLALNSQVKYLRFENEHDEICCIPLVFKFGEIPSTTVGLLDDVKR